MNENCLSYWFPKLLAAGLPVPKTKIVAMPEAAREAMFMPLDGKPIGEAAFPFLAELRTAVEEIGTPCFLRTGQTSGKHNWKDTCYLHDVANLESHVIRLIEFSEICDFIGLPWDVWCVRELLPTVPLMTADLYGGMPVCREYRFFVNDGEVVCSHPYWPLESLVDGMSKCPENLRELYRSMSKAKSKGDAPDDWYFDGVPSDLQSLAVRASKAVGGFWSVDILDTERGWYVTDMAHADRSWHWPGCEAAKQVLRE